MKKAIFKYIYIAIVLFFASLFVLKFGGQAILKAYVRIGIGDCRAIPILCMAPEKELNNPEIDKAYISELLPYSFPGQELPYSFPGLEVSIPKGFTVIRGSTTKVYYKRRKYDAKTPTVFLLYQKPNFFINLFPQLRKEGIENNYGFVTRTLYAQLENINNITDAFFVIMKSVFTPNIGRQENAGIVKFKMLDKRGFITYNMAPLESYFDCDIINSDDAFFKIYIKDKGKRLDLDKVLAIISTMHTTNIMAKDVSK